MSDYVYRVTPVGEPQPHAIEMNGTALALTGVSAGGAITLTWVPRRYDIGSPVERRAMKLKTFRFDWFSRMWLDTGFQAWRRRHPPKGGLATGFYLVERTART